MVSVTIALILTFLLLVCFIVGMVQMWTPHKRMTDEELYGMSGNAYALVKMGDEQFQQFFSEEEYQEAKAELEELRKKGRTE